MWGIPSMLRSANSCNRCDMPVNVIAISKSQARKIALVCCYLINLSYPLCSPKSKIFIHSISQFPFPPQSCFGYALILILIIKVMWILLLSSTWFSSQDVSCCVIFRGFFDKSDLYHNLAPPWFENPQQMHVFHWIGIWVKEDYRNAQIHTYGTWCVVEVRGRSRKSILMLGTI